MFIETMVIYRLAKTSLLLSLQTQRSVEVLALQEGEVTVRLPGREGGGHDVVGLSELRAFIC